MISPQKFQKYASSPAAFRADLIVDVDGSARKLGDAMQGNDWQRDDFAAVDPALMACNGRASADPSNRMRAYLERPRGHSKTTDLAVTACWALAFAARPVRGYCFAADQDQARLLKDAMATILRLNPWMAEILEVQKTSVINKASKHPGNGATLEIFTSDVASSYGILPDFIIADELTHWEGDGSLWHSLISSAAKRASCLLVVISNAGFADSWQWAVRETARTDEAWIFRRLDGVKATWMTGSRLDEMRRMLPPVAFARLFENVWSSGGGDALLPEDIEAAFVDDAQPMSGKESGWLFVAGIDLGLTRDCSAVVTLAFPKDGRYAKVRLADHKLWRPIPGKKIDLSEVEKYVLELDARFGLEQVAFDPWQAELLASRLEKDTGHRRRNSRRWHWTKPWCKEVTPSAVNLREQAGLVIEHFTDRRVAMYPCQPLRHDLMKVRAEEKSYGIRLVSPRDEHGHGDTFSAFAIALLVGHELAGVKRIVLGSLESPTSRGSGRWAEEFEKRQREYAESREALFAKPERSPFEEMMRFHFPDRMNNLPQGEDR